MKKVTFIIGIFFVFFQAQVYANCWNPSELSNIDGFSELDGMIILSFKDSVECTPVSGAEVTLDEITYTTDSKGYISFPLEKISDGDKSVLPLQINKKGYIPLKTGLHVEMGNIPHKRFLLSKSIPLDSVRVVLQWNKKPLDLDLHLKGEDFHISFRNLKEIPQKAKLDRDDRDGYGPETITLYKIDKSKNYKVFVHNYSNDSGFNGKGFVSVYANNSLDKKVRLPKTGAREVAVFEIVRGKLVYQ